MTADKWPNVDIEWHAEDIQARVRQLAHDLDVWYDHLDVGNVIAVIAMRGGLWFGADLTKAMNTNVDAVTVNPTSNFFPFSVHGEAVLVVDDIRESGRTLAHLRNLAMDSGAKYVDSVVLLERIHGVTPLLVGSHRWGFSVPHSKFLVGYGLDYDGQYRNLPYVGVFNGTEVNYNEYRTRDRVEGSV